jgi:hypothetical protein
MLKITHPDQLQNGSNSVLIQIINQRFFELGETTMYIIEDGDVISVFGDNYPVRLTTTILTG